MLLEGERVAGKSEDQGTDLSGTILLSTVGEVASLVAILARALLKPNLKLVSCPADSVRHDTQVQIGGVAPWIQKGMSWPRIGGRSWNINFNQQSPLSDSDRGDCWLKFMEVGQE